ncbi:hypothetical protein MHBO_002946 [Bonamia ostreae]|uniref:Profilin n=1 Tax=Bonamia ostreae TaxID=126728 RepID=A0ABV2AP13_9EUKA
MSWKQYGDHFENSKIHASILDIKNKAVLHKATGHEPTTENITKLSGDLEALTSYKFGSDNFIVINKDINPSSYNFLVGMKGDKSLLLAILRTIAIVAVTDKNEITPGNARNAIEKVCDQLYSHNL